jgi:hypothetical protein
MDEQEFDQRIRDQIYRNEANDKYPLWDKSKVWLQVDAGLKRQDYSGWWKAAALIAVLLSTGWSMAQWFTYREYQQTKELELLDLRKQNSLDIESEKNKTAEMKRLVEEQNQKIDLLQRSLLKLELEAKGSKPNISLHITKREPENHGPSKEYSSLVDSLKDQLWWTQNQLKRSGSSLTSSAQSTPENEVTTAEEVISPVRPIRFVSRLVADPQPSKERGLKIGILGFGENKEIEYKSDHSIFNK